MRPLLYILSFRAVNRIQSFPFSANSLPRTMSTSVNANKNSVLYNFWRGHPNNELLPAKEMQKILEHMASPTNQDRLKTSLQYLSSDRGDPALLKEISLFFRRHTLNDEIPQDAYTAPTIADAAGDLSQEIDMFLTHGVSHGIDMLCTSQTVPGDVVMIERPSYFLAAGIFRSHGLKVQSLPMKRQFVDGSYEGALMFDVDAFAQGLKDGSIETPRMIYIVPTHQNPTASTMPTADRWKLCQLARQFGFLVAADEVYHLLDWRDDKSQRPARFSILDHILSKQSGSSTADSSAGLGGERRTGCSVSINSFTKIFTPYV